MLRISNHLRGAMFLLAMQALVSLGAGAEPARDWERIVALDAGPQGQPRTGEAARTAAIAHLDAQEKALRGFLARHPGDSHIFEARLRLARLLQIRADVQGATKAMVEAQQILDNLERTATPEQRPELDFARITQLMRNLRQPTPAQRERLLAVTRKFQRDHPTDRRLAAVLAEVATLFEAQPEIMQSLLTDAQPLARDEELRARIADDLKRVNRLGEVVPLRFTSIQGPTIDLEQMRGAVVVLAFFAVWSPPSTAAIDSLQRVRAGFPRGNLQIVGVSLDAKAEPLGAFVREKKITWPIAYDGRGWESPFVRGLGVNALPTVWLLDKHGRLRSLNAMDGMAERVRELINEP